MVISQSNANEIDIQVSKGLHIGYFGKDSDLSSVPKMIGDWNIRTIEEHRSPGTGYVVAIPSNTRTRLIYNRGRIAWLTALGFSQQLAELYIRASSTIGKRWDHEVALFVLDNYAMDIILLDEAITSENPKRFLETENFYFKISRGKILAGCQILRNIRSFSK